MNLHRLYLTMFLLAGIARMAEGRNYIFIRSGFVEKSPPPGSIKRKTDYYGMLDGFPPQKKYYFHFVINAAQSAFRNPSFTPVAHFNYAYAGSPGQNIYSDSMHIASSSRAFQGTLGFEIGNAEGIFLGLDAGVINGRTLVEGEFGYNFRLRNKRFTVRPSIALSYTQDVITFPRVIQQNGGDVVVYDQTFPHHTGKCGCTKNDSNFINVGLESALTGLQYKIGFKYDVSARVAFQTSIGYWSTINSQLNLDIKNHAKEVRIPAPADGLDLRNTSESKSLFNANGFFWSVSFIYKFKLKSPPGNSGQRTHHYYPSHSYHSYHHC